MAKSSSTNFPPSSAWKGIAGLVVSQFAVNSPWLVNQAQALKAGQTVRPPEGYELVLTCVGLVIAAVGTFVIKVWKELEADAVRGTANMIKAAPGIVRDLMGRCWDAVFGTIGRWVQLGSFTRRYFAELRYKHGLFNDKGLGLINANRLDLENVYVEVKASADVQVNRSNVNPVSREIRERAPVWEHLRTLRVGFALVLIGAPGCGKTTLLQHVLLTFANNRQWRCRMRARIPFFIELRKIVPMLQSKDGLSLPKLLEAVLKQDRQTADIAKQLPKGWLEKVLRTGKCILLWDGLDEVADPAERVKVSAWLDGIGNKPEWRDNLSIVSARPAGYRAAPLDRGRVLEVQPFAFEDTKRFISQWYHATEVVSSGNKDNKLIRRRADDGTHELLNAIYNNPRLGDLTSNPLLLTMICMVHRYHGALPGSRSQLYAEICQVLLERWRQQRGVKDNYSGLQKLQVLRPLAAWMMENQTKEIRTDRLLSVAAEPLARIGVTAGKETALVFLKQLQEGSGLLLEREVDTWAFAHLSFQEFLCADDWVNQPVTAPTDWNSKVAESWWRETLLLYASRATDASPLIKAALDRNSAPALALVMQLQNEKLNINVMTRDRVEAAVVKSLGSRDRETFQAAGEAWLHHQQEVNYHRLDDGKQISSAVTQAEFQTFLMSSPAMQANTPPQWRDDWFPDAAKNPVLGVSAETASQYCVWLNSRFAAFHHRLPTPTECPEESVSLIWCHDGDHACLCWDCSTEMVTAVSVWLEMNPELKSHGTANEFVAALKLQSLARVADFDVDGELNSLASKSWGGFLRRFRARVLPLKFDRVLSLETAIDHVLFLALAIPRERNWGLDHNLGLALDRALDRARPRPRGPRRRRPGTDPDHVPGLGGARTVAHDLLRDLDVAWKNSLNRDYDFEKYFITLDDFHSFNLARSFTLARAGVHYLDPGRDRDLLGELASKPGLMGRRARCISPLMMLWEHEATSRSVVSAYRRFWVACFDAIREHDPKLITKEIAPVERLMRILVAREDGELPACEGIRVVRERRI